MSVLIVRHEFCAKVDDAGGLKLIADIITEHLGDEVCISFEFLYVNLVFIAYVGQFFICFDWH